MITGLITGVNGAIGLELARAMLATGKYRIIGLDLRDDCLGTLAGDDNFEFIKQDIVHPFHLPGNEKKVDILIHSAALVHRGAKDLSRENYFRINHVGTKNVLAALKTKQLRHIILLSTVSVYGGFPRGLIPDESTETRPVDFYGESKLMAEEDIIDFANSYDIPYSIFRLTPVYGPQLLFSIKKRILLPWGIAFYKISKGDQLVSLCSINNVVNVVSTAILQQKYYNQILIVKDRDDYPITAMINIYRTHLKGWNKPVVTIPHLFPRSIFSFIKLVAPGTGSWLLHQLDKVAFNTRYANGRLLSLSAPLDWDLDRTLRIQ